MPASTSPVLSLSQIVRTDCSATRHSIVGGVEGARDFARTPSDAGSICSSANGVTAVALVPRNGSVNIDGNRLTETVELQLRRRRR